MSANANLYSVLASGFPTDRSRVAIQTEQQSYSWADIDAISAAIANLLQSYGVPQGARIAVQVHKSPLALMLYLASLRAGLVYLPLNTAYQQDELAYFLADASPAIVVCDSAALDWCVPLAQKHGAQHVLSLAADGSGSLMDAATKHSQVFTTVASEGTDLAAILYTSGTTGRSKGAMLTHANLAANALTLKEYWDWSSADVLLHMLPIFHIHGLFVACHGALLAGARMLWLPKLDVDAALRYLPQCTIMMGVPTYYVRLLADARFNQQICAHMRLFISGSAPLLPETFAQFQARSGHTILERYGMSETGMLASNPYRAEQGARIAATVGPALPGVQIRVVDDNDQALAVAQPGHVQVRGPNVFAGYWQMPEKTRAEFTADGWFRTGDVGVFGGPDIPDDYLSIVGRSKDMIISGGYNVYPKEIELLLDTMPGVLESAVIGMPDEDFGEAVIAVIVPQEGIQPDLEALRQGLKDKLANYKVPKRCYLVEELPRNTMGKVQKNILRNNYTRA